MSTTTNIDTLEDQFAYELEHMYFVENKLVDVLDQLAAETTEEKISKGFADHRDETRNQVGRLEEVFRALGREPEQREAVALEGLVTDHERFKEATTNDDLQNLYNLGAGMKTERMEITGYESLLMIGEKLDYGNDVLDPLKENVDEEEKALDKLKTMSGGSGMKAMFDKLLG